MVCATNGMIAISIWAQLRCAWVIPFMGLACIPVTSRSTITKPDKYSQMHNDHDKKTAVCDVRCYSVLGTEWDTVIAINKICTDKTCLQNDSIFENTSLSCATINQSFLYCFHPAAAVIETFSSSRRMCWYNCSSFSQNSGDSSGIKNRLTAASEQLLKYGES